MIELFFQVLLSGITRKGFKVIDKMSLVVITAFIGNARPFGFLRGGYLFNSFLKADDL
jgi:hypothetical protein